MGGGLLLGGNESSYFQTLSQAQLSISNNMQADFLQTRMSSCLTCSVVNLKDFLPKLPIRHATDGQSYELCNNLGVTIVVEKHCKCQPCGRVDGPAGDLG